MSRWIDSREPGPLSCTALTDHTLVFWSSEGGAEGPKARVAVVTLTMSLLYLFLREVAKDPLGAK